MNIISLIKKDFLLMKRYLFLTVAFMFGVPLLLLWKAPEAIGLGGFMVTAFMTFVTCEQQLSVFYVKYPKALALLFATPYKRSEYVIARYAFFSLLFIVALALYNAVYLFSRARLVSVQGALSAYLLWSVFLGVYLPLQFKLGYEKMKYAMMALILFPPIVLPLIAPYVRNLAPYTAFTIVLSQSAWLLLFVFASTIITAVSIAISVQILNNKEL